MMQPPGHESPRERSFRLNRAVRSDMMAVWNLITGKCRFRRLGRGLARGRRDGFPRLVSAGVVVAGRIIDRTIDRRTVHSSGR